MSCLALFDACRRIVVVAGKNSEDIKVNVTAMFIHVSAYMIYLIGLLYFFITSFATVSGELTTDEWLVN